MSDFQDYINTVIKKGNIKEVRRQWQPQYKNQRYNGRTALHWACAYSGSDQGNLVRLLMSLGCDMEAQIENEFGWWPLHVSAFDGTMEAMRALLEAGCNPSCLDKDRETPMMVAKERGHSDCVSLLKSAIEDRWFQRPTLTNYEKGDLLGQGSYGDVYKCYDPNIKMYFAAKMVKLTVAAGNEDVKVLENEIKVFSKLNYHKRIVRYLGTNRNEVEMIIFLEYAPNGSLKEELKKSGPFSFSDVTKYSRQILEGLEFLHGRKIIHRDIKAANILRDAEDDIKLADFGISKSLQTISSGTTRSAEVGTPHWMAPEVIKGTSYDYRADVWSLGATILEMLTGKTPFHEFESIQVMFKIANGASVDPYFPSHLNAKTKLFLKKMFIHDPFKRADVKTLLECSFFKDS